MLDRPTKFLQENLLTLLCYDADSARIIRNAISLDLYDGIYRELASKLHGYIDQYNEPPKDHVADLFELELKGETNGRYDKEDYIEIIQSLRDTYPTIQPRYILDKLETFIRKQQFKSTILRSAELIQTGNEEDVDEVETIWSEILKNRLAVFDPGVKLTDTKRAFEFLTLQDESFLTGIPEFDKRQLGPQRKALHLFIALPKKGKTAWLIHLSRMALLQRHNVLHISLELSERYIVQRYYQTLFAMAKREGEYSQTKFEFDELGRLSGLERDVIIPKLTMDDPSISKKLKDKVTRFGFRLDSLLIQCFPTGALTIQALRVYLDLLESQIHFIPDLVLLDYPDLMKINMKDYRHNLGHTYVALRGLAVEYNFALAVVTQSNRSGLNSELIDEGMVSEDFSKIATADTIITYSQTKEEKAMGLARLFVTSGRTDEDKIGVVISQNYSTGQFVLGSTRLLTSYNDRLDVALAKGLAE